MATYVMQGQSVPTDNPVVLGATGIVVYSLTSAANGTALTGTGDRIGVMSDSAGWLHVSTTAATDKAAVSKSHRVLATTRLELGGVAKGMFVSFLADS